MLSRVAAELFWMSRYVERATTVARLSEVTWHLELDAGIGSERGDQLWAPLLGFGSDGGQRFLAAHPEPRPEDVRSYLAFDPDNENALVACVRRARTAAQGVRDHISSEMWEQINQLTLSLANPSLAVEAEQDATGFYRRLREGLLFFQGLADATMAHDDAWSFINLGTYLERADSVAHVLELEAHLLTAGLAAGRDEPVHLLAVLRSCGAAEAYARYYSLRVEPARVVEFVLLNPTFPQSVRFSLERARAALQEINGGRSLNEARNAAVRAMGRLCARLEHAAVDEVFEEGIAGYLAQVRQRIGDVGHEVTERYFRTTPAPAPLVGVARAAQILAQQQ